MSVWDVSATWNGERRPQSQSLCIAISIPTSVLQDRPEIEAEVERPVPRVVPPVQAGLRSHRHIRAHRHILKLAVMSSYLMCPCIHSVTCSKCVPDGVFRVPTPKHMTLA